MWEWLKQADNLKAVGTIGGAVATGYGAYEQSKAMKEQNSINKDLLALQKADYNRGIAKEDKAQDALDSAIGLTWGKKKEEEDKLPSMNIGA